MSRRPRRPAVSTPSRTIAPRVTVYHAAGCSLCARALEVVREAQAELGFDLDVVDIGGRAELEEHYRERLPVVEIDGVAAFTYFVDAAALRERLGAVPPASSDAR